jgi:hypothetical protein
MLIFLEEPDEEECPNSLVPIREWVILDDEIEEMCRLGFDRRIEVDSVKGRNNRGEDTDETLIFLIPEYIIRFALFNQL